MRTTTQNALGVILAAVAALGCPTDATTPSGGGQQTETRSCRSGNNSGWQNNQLGIEVSKPPCPFVIRLASSDVTFAGRATAPASRIEFNGSTVISYTNFTVHNWYNGQALRSDNFNYFQQSPSDPSVYFSEMSLTAQPGYSPESPGSDKLLDSLHVDAYWMDVGGFVYAWKILPGRIDPNAQSMIGPNATVSNQSTTWRSYTPWDTSAYTYKWLLNGSLVSGAEGATYATSLSTGTHTIKSITIRADNTADTVTTTVKAFNGSISGPSSVRPFVTCSFSASASGASSPYSYSWTAPGSGGSGEWFDYYNTTPDGGSFTVQVAITDASGATIYISKNVNVSTSAPECMF